MSWMLWLGPSIGTFSPISEGFWASFRGAERPMILARGRHQHRPQPGRAGGKRGFERAQAGLALLAREGDEQDGVRRGDASAMIAPISDGTLSVVPVPPRRGSMSSPSSITPIFSRSMMSMPVYRIAIWAAPPRRSRKWCRIFRGSSVPQTASSMSKYRAATAPTTSRSPWNCESGWPTSPASWTCRPRPDREYE